MLSFFTKDPKAKYLRTVPCHLGLRRRLFDRMVEWARLALLLETRCPTDGHDTLLWKFG